MPSYYAINLKDFHANQNGVETTVQIRFINAKNTAGAAQHLRDFYPGTAWSIVPKKTVDANIVYFENRDASTPQPEFTLRAFTGDDITKLDKNSTDFKENCIGYMRSDFGAKGNEFWYTWWPNREDLNTPEFKEFFNRYVDWLKEDAGVLGSFAQMKAYCKSNPEAEIKFNAGPSFGFATESKTHTFYLRCIPRLNDYNGYCFVYTRSRE